MFDRDTDVDPSLFEEAAISDAELVKQYPKPALSSKSAHRAEHPPVKWRRSRSWRFDFRPHNDFTRVNMPGNGSAEHLASHPAMGRTDRLFEDQ